MDKILFVCTSNVFRSMSAHYILQDYALKNNLNIQASSAGINVIEPLIFDNSVFDELDKLGIYAFDHLPRQITQKIIDDHDLIVAMAENHQKYLKDNFNVNAILYNEIITGKKSSLKDVSEVLNENTQKSIPQWDQYMITVIDYIYNNVPNFVQNYKKY